MAVLALGGDGISAVTDLVAFVNSDPKKTGKRLGNNLLGKASVRTGTVFVFPDGLANRIGEMLCGLYPLKVLPGGAIQLVTDVPSRAVAYLMTAEREDLLRAARDVATTALQAVRVPRFALVFDCVSRSLLLGNGCEEVAIIRETLGPLPFVGFLTFGEVAPYDDVPLFHNKSLVIAVGGE